MAARQVTAGYGWLSSTTRPWTHSWLAWQRAVFFRNRLRPFGLEQEADRLRLLSMSADSSQLA